VKRRVYGVCAYLGKNGGVVVVNKPRKEQQNTIVSKKNNERRKRNLLAMFETLSNTSVSCRTRRTRVTWHSCMAQLQPWMLQFGVVEGVWQWSRWPFTLEGA
jgi:hypothetical protein